MVNNIEPRVGNGGTLALLVGIVATVIVLGAIVYTIVGGLGSSSPPPAPSRTVFTGSFGLGTATCPGTRTPVAATSCDIPITLPRGGFKATLDWTSSDALSFELIGPDGRPVTPAASGSDGSAGLTISLPSVTAGSYHLRVIDVNAVGGISFSAAVE